MKIREILFPIKELPHWYTLTSPENGAVASPEKRRFLFGGDVTRSPAKFPGETALLQTRQDTPEFQTQTKFVVSYRTQQPGEAVVLSTALRYASALIRASALFFCI